jgi:hypothetical protein
MVATKKLHQRFPIPLSTETCKDYYSSLHIRSIDVPYFNLNLG